MTVMDHGVTSKNVAQQILSDAHHSMYYLMPLRHSGMPARHPLFRLPFTGIHRHLRHQCRIRIWRHHVERPLNCCIMLHPTGSAPGIMSTVGEVVVVENSLKNRTLWSLARVIQLIPGKNGHVRVARVKTEPAELVRPVQRLYKLELQEPEINLSKDLTDSVIRTRRGRKITTPKRLTYA
ncbi:hypothetical protein TNCV_4512901 [Trichonephila clavipes]|nr:hypothetical protein TNCV_4512901 [Trichonephila clavipes]